MLVADLMTRDVKTCVPSDTLDRTAHVMLAHDCGCVPVVDGERRPVGIITDRDVAMAAFVTGRALHDIDVERTMTGRLVTCRATDAADAARAVLRDEEVRRLPVVDDDGKLVGIVSLSDLTQAAGKERTAAARKKEAFDVFETLGVVTKPRDERYFDRFSAKPARRKASGKAAAKTAAKTAGKATRKPAVKKAAKGAKAKAPKAAKGSKGRKKTAKAAGRGKLARR